MEKEVFIQVLKSSAAQSAADADAILQLRNQYPFSQVLHTLSARVSKDHSMQSMQSILQIAAVYSTDRAVLKDVMTRDFVQLPPKEAQAPDVTPPVAKPVEKESPKIEPKPAQPAAEPTKAPAVQPAPVAKKSDAESPKTVVTPRPAETPRPIVTHKPSEKDLEKTIEQAIAHVDVADVIMKDLARLHQLKHNFEMLFTDSSTVSVPEPPAAAPVAPPQVAVPEEKADPPVETPRTKREKIIALAREKTGAEGPPPAPKRKRKDQDHIIEEIKTSKEELEPESERQKEQIQIIDHFIKTQPSITNAQKERAVQPQQDLNSIKSGEFGENIISETLVEILVKQGKKDRAIEVLKKLIWKYPQKKAYFASQIEELKK